MEKNVALALILSFVILFGWEAFVVRPKQKGLPPPAAQTVSAVATPAGPAAAPTPAADTPDVLVDYETGHQKVSFNLFGASVNQWAIQEHEKSGRWVQLVPQGIAKPLGTFAALKYGVVRRTPQEIAFAARRADGLTVDKVFRLQPEGHMHELALTFTNRGKQPLTFDYDIGWGPGIESGDADHKERARSQRVLVFDPPRLLKLKVGTHEGPAQWWAVDSRYFFAAFLLDSVQNVHVSVEKEDKLFVAKQTTTITLQPGESASRVQRFYLGPKGYNDLKALGFGLERAVDFGYFGSVGRIVQRFLYFLYGLMGNYGWAIIVLTFCVQVLALPLTRKSFLHGARMRELQPQMKKLQELYKSDPKRLNAEMLNLYQKNGLRFMGMEGCFPMLIQLPVFWALYTTLRNTYELRGADWIGWVRDLSAADPYYVLPVLMGIAMLAQQKLTMSSVDPAQARMMYIMPVMFTFFFLKLPSGLVLYWLTNSLLSIVIQTVLLKKHQESKVLS